MNQVNRNVFVISGPSGVGKGSLIKLLTNNNPNFKLAVSATTRSIRPGEIEGKDYYFLSKDQFEAHINAKNFIEYCKVHGNYYGTLKSELVAKNDTQKIIIEIDTQGVEKIKALLNAIYIFIAPSTKKDLYERLIKRDTDDPQVIRQRIKNSKKELKKLNNYDYVLINKSLDTSITILNSLLKE